MTIDLSVADEYRELRTHAEPTLEALHNAIDALLEAGAWDIKIEQYYGHGDVSGWLEDGPVPEGKLAEYALTATFGPASSDSETRAGRG